MLFRWDLLLTKVSAGVSTIAAPITWWFALVRTFVYKILGIFGVSAQPYQAAAFHTFNVLIPIACDSVLRWTKANRTGAVVKLMPL
jgi:hypothetical protein